MLIIASGCGGNDNGDEAAIVVPADLVGTYERTVEESEPGAVPPGL